MPRPNWASSLIPTCSDTPAASPWLTGATIRGPCRLTWAIATFSTPFATPNCPPIGSRISGGKCLADVLPISKLDHLRGHGLEHTLAMDAERLSGRTDWCWPGLRINAAVECPSPLTRVEVLPLNSLKNDFIDLRSRYAMICRRSRMSPEDIQGKGICNEYVFEEGSAFCVPDDCGQCDSRLGRPGEGL